MAARRGVTLALLVLILLAGAAAPASAASLSLVARAPFSLPLGSDLEGGAYAAYTLDTSQMSEFRLTATRLDVAEQEARRARVATEPVVYAHQLERRPTTYSLHDVELHLQDGTPYGFWGLYPDMGSTLSLQAASPLNVSPRMESALGDNPNPERAPDPAQPAYSSKKEGPHLYMAGAGTLTFHGSGWLKLGGVVLEQVSRDNRSVIDARTTRASEAPVHELRERWVLLRFEDAHIVVNTTAQIEALVGEAAGYGEGTIVGAHLRGLSGEASGGLVHGTWDIAVSPRAEDGRALAVLDLQGIFTTSTMQGQTSIIQPPPGAAPWVPPLLIGAALATAATSAISLLVRRRGRKETATPKRDLLLEAVHHERTAHELKQRARRLPVEGLPNLVELEGARRRSVDLALDAYDKASREDPWGDAAFCAACLCVQEGRPEEAEAFIERSLARKPSIIHRLPEEPLLEKILSGRPRFEAARTRARASLGRSTP